MGVTSLVIGYFETQNQSMSGYKKNFSFIHKSLKSFTWYWIPFAGFVFVISMSKKG